MGYPPVLADPEIAALKFKTHLDALWTSGKPDRDRWVREKLNDLTWRIELAAIRPSGEEDRYWVKLGAQYYDESGPTVVFVNPETNEPAPAESRWLPKLTQNPNWFAIHPLYNSAQYSGQLVCYSYNAYYEFTHGRPNSENCWVQGVHTVAAALYRLEEALGKEYYACPSNIS